MTNHLQTPETVEPDLLDLIVAGSESAIDFHEAARLPAFMKGGRPVAVGSIHRFASKGVKGVRLESARVGGCRVTTAAAVARFARRITDSTRSRDRGKPTTVPTAPAHRAAVQELEAAGVL